MNVISDLFDGMVVYLSPTSTFSTENFDKVLATNGALVVLNINSRVNFFVCDSHDSAFESSGASDLGIKAITEQFFIDSIAVGSLRLEKSYYTIFSARKSLKRLPPSENSRSVKKTVHDHPVDKNFPGGSDWSVYKEGTFYWDATLNLTNIENNNNKFYILQLLTCTDGSYCFWTRWGRQGSTSQNMPYNTTTIGASKALFEKKFRDKTGNTFSLGRAAYRPVPGKYVWLEFEYGDETSSKTSSVKNISAPTTSLTTMKPTGSTVVLTLDPRVADLVQLIFDNRMMTKTVTSMNYDVKQLPLGKLSKNTLRKALAVLKEIEDILTSGKFNMNKIADCSNRFYTYIPHSSGKQRLPYIDNLVILESKLDLLKTLDEIDEAEKLKKNVEAEGDVTIHPLEKQYKQLNMTLTPLDKSTPLFAMLERYVKRTHAPTHTDYTLKILDIFEINRPGDHAFVEYEALHNQQLLWHGSRMSNWVGILSQGLRIAPPEAPVTGYMFGKGVYFADLVSKSANYCATNKTDNIGFLLACQVALGSCWEKTSAFYVNKLPTGYDSCKGLGLSQPDPKLNEYLDDGTMVPTGYPVANPDVSESDLLYNEYIVYQLPQIKFRYLFKFQFMYK